MNKYAGRVDTGWAAGSRAPGVMLRRWLAAAEAGRGRRRRT
jgi:hypothetical protein